MKSQILSIDLLELDRDTQNRLSINEETVEEYAELIAEANGGEWPLGPLDVFHDGNEYLVADGFHRTLAAQRAKRASIPCRVHKGTAKDARIFGMTANDKHGLRMSRADKRACVEWLLDNGGKMSQKLIGEMAGVSRRTVGYIVAERKSVQIAHFETHVGGDSQNGEKTSSEKGKPGGVVSSSSQKAPVESGPASDSTAASETDPEPGEDDRTDSEGTDSQEATPETPGTGREPKEGPGDSESVGTASKTPEQLISEQRSKTVKTVEALMRAFDDLHRLKRGKKLANSGILRGLYQCINQIEDGKFGDVHEASIFVCKSLLETAKNWK